MKKLLTLALVLTLLAFAGCKQKSTENIDVVPDLDTEEATLTFDDAKGDPDISKGPNSYWGFDEYMEYVRSEHGTAHQIDKPTIDLFTNIILIDSGGQENTMETTMIKDGVTEVTQWYDRKNIGNQFGPDRDRYQFFLQVMNADGETWFGPFDGPIPQ